MEANWYPSHAQLDTPEKLERAFRETLRHVYDTRTQVKGLHEKVNAMPIVAGTKASQVPDTTTSYLNGLPIEPIDTTQLADGTRLTYVAATRSFKFLP